MSRKECSPDNAACEGFFGRLKTELFYFLDLRDTTIDQYVQVLDSDIRWYSATRIRSRLTLSASPNTVNVMELQYKPVRDVSRNPSGSVSSIIQDAKSVS